MKPTPEMHEGPEAFTRFEDTMRKLFSVKKVDLAPNPFGKSGKKRVKTKSVPR